MIIVKCDDKEQTIKVFHNWQKRRLQRFLNKFVGKVKNIDIHKL